MMQTAIDKFYLIDKNPISGKDGKTEISPEICGCDPSQEAGIFLSVPQIVKAIGQGISVKVSQPNPNLKSAAVGLSSVGLEDPNRQMHMLNPCGTRTRIICLTNAVEDEELSCDEKFDHLLEELEAEGREFGNLVKIVIPRPNQDHDLTPGVGKAFFEYADLDGASRARSEMNRQYFGRNLVEAVYFPENKYARGDYDG